MISVERSSIWNQWILGMWRAAMERRSLRARLLLGLTTGAIMVLYLSLFDLDYPFDGLWRVEPLGLRRLRQELGGQDARGE